MKRKLTVFPFLALLLLACSPTLYMPDSRDANTQPLLLEGRKLYVSHCSSCHNLHLPDEYTAITWSHNLDEMQSKAKINDKEKLLIFNYLTSKH